MRVKSKRARVLCIARSRHILGLLERAIQASEFEVLMAATTDLAVAFCISHHVDAVVLDSIMLENRGDWTVAQTLKSIRPALPILVLSDKDIETELSINNDLIVVPQQAPEQIATALASVLRRGVVP